MADLDLTQIVTAIESLFTERNHFVFWFDDQGEFVDNITEIATALKEMVIVMQPQEQFKTKIQLVDMQRQQQDALVYSPAPMPPIELNHLEDFIRFSKRYSADATSMLLEELGIPENNRTTLVTYASFFANKERKERFKTRYHHQSDLEMVMMSALAKAKDASMTSILQAVCQDTLDANNQYLVSFDKYGLLTSFWSHVERAYGFSEAQPTLLHLMTAMFVNTAFDQAEIKLPTGLHAYTLTNNSNAITYLKNTRDSVTYRGAIKQIANQVWLTIQGDQLFGRLEIIQLVKVDVFPEVDPMILKWLTGRLVAEDYSVQVNNQSIPELIADRLTRAYAEDYQIAYQLQNEAFTLLTLDLQATPNNFETAVTQYVSHDYQLDTSYRLFTMAFSQIQPQLEATIEPLRNKVEAKYLNDFLSAVVPNWTANYAPSKVPTNHQQSHFYYDDIRHNKERTVVLISDAFRFEAGKSLQAQLDSRDVVDTSMDYRITGLPSVTYFGMPALLPNQQLTYTHDNTVLVDGQEANNTEKRELVLQNVNPNSRALQVKDFLEMDSKKRKATLTDQKVIYLYHNIIDTTGEKSITEQTVFSATDKTINELARTIEILRNLSVSHIVVTADHGYIYRQSALDSANKIDVAKENYDAISGEKKEQRYLISQKPLQLTGVIAQSLGELLGNEDSRWISYPKNFDIFSAPGPSQNYVHGGCSPQEMIIPVLDIHTRKGRSQAAPVTVHDVTAMNRITSREVNVQIMQDDALSDTVIAASFRVYFVDDQNQVISEIQTLTAESTADLPTDRIQTLRLALKDVKYATGQHYSLVIQNTDTKTEKRSDYTMDMVIGGGFGFDI
ncbi:BREX-1 system phosphatase PglZ type A [Lactobacillus sp. LC28-10]|uniref:BREX-1 system phosphatase PglZ type A n=1 Tax=Secundilactobacillus angelensis TaxID=2722706 RepID=A0ABX1KWG0_9LACO|nr:BREX-1 system phosphatase PglZ type A [Secundilactobacillus angelensis]MCH5461951.1 BREX-1 system phosphatase PglZ type A [Secundilactobacillus angelensis]NLR17439.1 BREX-1 system phosphatase PglZ type A [Secundilactobacillus angelensis]